jgi:DNA processing protein
MQGDHMSAAAIFAQPTVSPTLELGAYESLWAEKGQTFKRLADLFKGDDLPSRFVRQEDARKRADKVLEIFRQKHVEDASLILNGMVDYPPGLREARYPVQLLYYRGDFNLLFLPTRVAVVGSRNASEDGLRRTRKLAKCLVEDGAVVVSGLARGIDTAAHTAAIEAGGNTIAVIGTPISEVYPKENRELQETIAREHLLVSQVPIIRYLNQTFEYNRFFFPERNVTMSALTQATVIVEAGETSGSLTQARAALAQGRKLFILENCFQKGLRWPERFLVDGAIRVTDYADIRRCLDL